MRLRCIKTFGFEWFYLHYSLYFTLLLVNFSWIVSANRCRFVKLNYLNLGALCGCDIFIVHFSTFSVILDVRLSQHGVQWFMSKLSSYYIQVACQFMCCVINESINHLLS
jgi:hypothetical protein